MPKDTHSTLPAGADLLLPEQGHRRARRTGRRCARGAARARGGRGAAGAVHAAGRRRGAAGWPKGRHNPERVVVRHGTQLGQVTLGGRRVRVDRPRVRRADGAGELPLPTWQA